MQKYSHLNCQATLHMHQTTQDIYNHIYIDYFNSFSPNLQVSTAWLSQALNLLPAPLTAWLSQAERWPVSYHNPEKNAVTTDQTRAFTSSVQTSRAELFWAPAFHAKTWQCSAHAASHMLLLTPSKPCLLGTGVETRISPSVRLTNLHHIWRKQGALLRKKLFQVFSGAQCIDEVTRLLSFCEYPAKLHKTWALLLQTQLFLHVNT